MEELKKRYTAEELLQFAYKHNQVPVVLFAKDKDGRYVYTSEVEDLVDGGEEHTILGKTDKDIQRDKELGELYYKQDQEIMRTGNPCHCYSEFVEDGEIVYREIAKNPVYSDGKLIGVCGVVSDVTELMSMKRKFESLTFTDKLTGVYNRNYILKYDFNRAVKLPCAYIMCDCNNLKKVNDKLGHQAGDDYIKGTAEILESILPENGICVRWGGDEFLLIIPQCERDACEQLIEEIEQKQIIMRKKLPYMEIAAGYSVRYDIRQEETETIETADRNMYEDKMRKKMVEWK